VYVQFVQKLFLSIPGQRSVPAFNLGLVRVGLLEVRLDSDDRAVELPADAAEVGEDGRQAPQRRVEQLAQLVVLGVLVGFDYCSLVPVA
jgi:hypothetical protein